MLLPLPAQAADRIDSASVAAAVDAVQASVRARLGGRGVVTVDEVVSARIEAPAVAMTAIPEPSARIGRVARFLLAEKSAGGRVRRVGEISALVRAQVPVARAARAIPGGQMIGAGDVTDGDADLDGLPLRPLPDPAAVPGSRARRTLMAGAIVSSADVSPALLVHAGESVTVHVAMDGVTVSGVMVAAESGALGDVVRVVNAGNRRARARVVAPAEVEMVDVH